MYAVVTGTMPQYPSSAGGEIFDHIEVRTFPTKDEAIEYGVMNPQYFTHVVRVIDGITHNYVDEA